MEKKYNDYTYDIYTNCYFYDCKMCKSRVCCNFINDCLCAICDKEFNKQLDALKKDFGFEKFRSSNIIMIGSPAVEFENKVKEFNMKVAELKKKYCQSNHLI